MLENTLLQRLNNSEPSAWKELLNNYARSIYRWALCFGIDQSGAEEVTQEVFITAFKRIETCRSQKQLSSWLFQVTRRHAANYRRRERFSSIFGTSKIVSESVDTPRTLPTGNDEPLQLSLELRQTLRKIPMKLAEVLILHDLDGHTRQEISEILSVPQGTVASRLQRARRAFEKSWG